jgi:hypothetical protein
MTVNETSKLAERLSQLLPLLKSCDNFSMKKGDMLVHAPGFEDRTMAVPDFIVSPEIAHAILLDYVPFDPANRLKDVRDALSAKRIKVTDEDIIIYNRFAPGDFEMRLRSRLLAQDTQRVILDISTMSKLAIMLTLNVCCELDLEVTIIYAEAEEYGPSQEKFNEAVQKNEIHRPTLQVFTGVYGVIRVNSLASVAMQGQPTAALVFMSFNDSLTQTLLNTVYPSRLFLINGRPPIHRWRESATAWIHDQVRREWEADNPVNITAGQTIPLPLRVVSTLDYRETVYLLLQLYWELSTKYRLLLAPAGSKLQAVGSYIVKALHPDIHIEYPSPEGFFPRYSERIAAKWMLEMGRMSELLRSISKAEREENLEIRVG